MRDKTAANVKPYNRTRKESWTAIVDHMKNNQFKTKHEAQNKRKHSWLCMACDAVYTTKPSKGLCQCGAKSLQYFPSQAELRRFYALKLELRAGLITDLELQPSYPVVINGQKVTTYKADFKYNRDGVSVVEDVKGTLNEKYLDPVFLLKRKLIEAIYGITITITKG